MSAKPQRQRMNGIVCTASRWHKTGCAKQTVRPPATEASGRVGQWQASSSERLADARSA
eukprot:CAMPEP_0174748594 /NCGR_PEP_ID=MMETSP1094-20130205/93842_1 /TAXON_ID=156173 /ORGANISM="Chrysochromulina brevifilum, Strain UTEX LB 985" /LENGTH=58 /DNA_ID=CAMNT_0015953661 /DNA_START=371 /DNA_END=547 /DNA_ORIENTATION=+